MQNLFFVFIQSCLGLVLGGVRSGQYLKNALKLNTSFFGPTNVNTALKWDAIHIFQTVLSTFQT